MTLLPPTCDTPSSHLRCIPKPPATAALTIGLYHLHALAETDKKCIALLISALWSQTKAKNVNLQQLCVWGAPKIGLRRPCKAENAIKRFIFR